MFFSTKKKRSFSKLNAAEKEQRIVSGAFRAVCLHSLVFSTSLCYSRGFFLFVSRLGSNFKAKIRIQSNQSRTVSHRGWTRHDRRGSCPSLLTASTCTIQTQEIKTAGFFSLSQSQNDRTADVRNKNERRSWDWATLLPPLLKIVHTCSQFFVHVWKCPYLFALGAYCQTGQKKTWSAPFFEGGGGQRRMAVQG